MRIFGSVARGEDRFDSDVDFLVEMEPGRSLLDLVAVWQDLEDLLGCKVDVVTDGRVSPLLPDRIYAEATPLDGRAILGRGCEMGILLKI